MQSAMSIDIVFLLNTFEISEQNNENYLIAFDYVLL